MDATILESFPTYFSGHSSETKEKYFAACEWMKSLGINYSKTRFGVYRKDFSLFLNPARKDIPVDDVELLKEFYEFLQAQTEAVQLIRLMNTYQNRKCEGFLETFKKVVKGVKLRRDTVNAQQDHARDLAFELSIASRFLIGGFSVDLNQVADLIVGINGKKLFIECKRIRSESQLIKRVKHANHQITKRLNLCISNKPRGLIALDLTDLINPTSQFIVCNDQDEFYSSSLEPLHSYVNENTEILKTHADKRCLGALCEKTSIGFLIGGKEPVIGHARSATILNYHEDLNSENFIDEFCSKIGNQNI